MVGSLRLSDAQQSARRPCGNFLGRLLYQEGVLPQSHNQQICVIFLCEFDDSVNFIPINQFGIERDAGGIHILPSGGLMQCMFGPRAFNPLLSRQRRNIP